MPGESEMTIRWEMDKTGDYTLEYGKSKARTKKFKLTLRKKKHNAFLYEAGLTKLKPGETYYYRLMGHTGWKSFKTYRNNQDRFTFVAMGDSRSNPDIFKKILDETVLENPDFIISMGDLVEGGGINYWPETNY